MKLTSFLLLLVIQGALVTSSDALVPSSFLMFLDWHSS